MARSKLKEIRRLRLWAYVETFGGQEKAKNVAAAEALDIQPSDLAQLKMGRNPETGNGRNITEDRARKMEGAANLPHKYFDGDEAVGPNLDGLDEADHGVVRLVAAR